MQRILASILFVHLEILGDKLYCGQRQRTVFPSRTQWVMGSWQDLCRNNNQLAVAKGEGPLSSPAFPPLATQAHHLPPAEHQLDQVAQKIKEVKSRMNKNFALVKGSMMAPTLPEWAKFSPDSSWAKCDTLITHLHVDIGSCCLNNVLTCINCLKTMQRLLSQQRSKHFCDHGLKDSSPLEFHVQDAYRNKLFV